MPKGKGPGAPFGNKNAAGPHKGYHGLGSHKRSNRHKPVPGKVYHGYGLNNDETFIISPSGRINRSRIDMLYTHPMGTVGAMGPQRFSKFNPIQKAQAHRKREKKSIGLANRLLSAVRKREKQSSALANKLLSAVLKKHRKK